MNKIKIIKKVINMVNGIVKLKINKMKIIKIKKDNTINMKIKIIINKIIIIMYLLLNKINQ
jgi:hypothetical protein